MQRRLICLLILLATPTACVGRPGPSPTLPHPSIDGRYAILTDANSYEIVAEGDYVSFGKHVAGDWKGEGFLTVTSADAAWTSKGSGGLGGLRLARVPCVRIGGALHGANVGGQNIHFKPWTADAGIAGVRSGTGGAFRACLPAGRYVASAEGPNTKAWPIAVNVSPGASISLDGYDPAAPPPVMRSDVGEVTGRDIADMGHARLLGIGEPDHGGQTYLDLRFSIVLAAAARGPVVVALEAGAPEVFPLDDYVRGENVDLRRAVAAMGYWIWDTEEFLTWLEAVRAYNSMFPTRRITLLGADVQYHAEALAYLLKHRDQVPLLDTSMALIEKTFSERRVAVPNGHELERLRRDLLSVAAGHTDPDAVEGRVALAASVLKNKLDMVTGVGNEMFAARDRGMAENIDAVAKGLPHSRIVFLAHNTHVSKALTEGVKMAGTYLAEQWGTEYRSVALLAYSGTTRAWDEEGKVGVGPIVLPAPKTGSVEAVLGAGGGGMTVAYELVRLPREVYSWLQQPRLTRDFGPVYLGEKSWREQPIAAGFDYAFIMKGIVPTTPTATGVRRAP